MLTVGLYPKTGESCTGNSCDGDTRASAGIANRQDLEYSEMR